MTKYELFEEFAKQALVPMNPVPLQVEWTDVQEVKSAFVAYLGTLSLPEYVSGKELARYLDHYTNRSRVKQKGRFRIPYRLL